MNAGNTTTRKVSPHTAALRLGTCRQTVYNLIQRGVLRAEKVGAKGSKGRLRICESDLEQILQERTQAEKAREVQ
jgi:excisionase family DNA binding protein